MSKRANEYDPLHFVPSPEVIQEKLQETLTLADRLRLLLELAERLKGTRPTADQSSRAPSQGVAGE